MIIWLVINQEEILDWFILLFSNNWSTSSIIINLWHEKLKIIMVIETARDFAFSIKVCWKSSSSQLLEFLHAYSLLSASFDFQFLRVTNWTCFSIKKIIKSEIVLSINAMQLDDYCIARSDRKLDIMSKEDQNRCEVQRVLEMKI